MASAASPASTFASTASRGPIGEDSVLDDILTPMERNVKTYLVNAMSKDLIELLALLAVERPDDPHLWLGVRLLERSPNGPYIAHKRSELVRRKPAAPRVVASGATVEGAVPMGGGGGGGGGGAEEGGGVEASGLSAGGGGSVWDAATAAEELAAQEATAEEVAMAAAALASANAAPGASEETVHFV